MCPSKCFPGKYWVIPHFSPTNSTSTFLKLSALRRFYHYIPDAIRRCQVTIVISSCRPRLQWIVLICEGLLRLVRSLLLRDRGSAYSGVRLLRTTAVPPSPPFPFANVVYRALIFLFSWPSNLRSRPWLVTRSLLASVKSLPRVRPSFTNNCDELNAARREFIETGSRVLQHARKHALRSRIVLHYVIATKSLIDSWQSVEKQNWHIYQKLFKWQKILRAACISKDSEDHSEDTLKMSFVPKDVWNIFF